jgi:hypothetical protein
MSLSPQPQPHHDAFEDGRKHALKNGSVADCPVPLSNVSRRAAWLDGYEHGLRGNEVWIIGDE